MAKYEFSPENSSSITLVLYDDETQVLGITFTSGRVYDYKDVPIEVYNELLDAPSAGKYFQQNIKGKFELKV